MNLDSTSLDEIAAREAAFADWKERAVNNDELVLAVAESFVFVSRAHGHDPTFREVCNYVREWWENRYGSDGLWAVEAVLDRRFELGLPELQPRIVVPGSRVAPGGRLSRGEEVNNGSN